MSEQLNEQIDAVYPGIVEFISGSEDDFILVERVPDLHMFGHTFKGVHTERVDRSEALSRALEVAHSLGRTAETATMIHNQDDEGEN